MQFGWLCNKDNELIALHADILPLSDTHTHTHTHTVRGKVSGSFVLSVPGEAQS